MFLTSGTKTHTEKNSFSDNFSCDSVGVNTYSYICLYFLIYNILEF